MIDWTKLRRNYTLEPLKREKGNKYEDLTYSELSYLISVLSFCEITKLLRVSDHYLQRVLRKYNLKTVIDRRKNPNKLSSTAIELQKYGKLGLSRKEKLNITIDKLGREEYKRKTALNFSKSLKARTKEAEALRQAKRKKTLLLKYGKENYNNLSKIKETCLKKYGVSYAVLRKELKQKVQTEEVKEKQKKSRIITWNKKSKEEKKKIYDKVHQTRKLNGTLASSKSFEDLWYNRLIKTFPEYTIKRQYKEERYPFSCDFYIKELDLFIEMQGRYFHNYRPFTGSSKDIAEYNKMKGGSKQIRAIAEVWRYRDVNKRNIAKQNKLNYIEFWEGETDLIERIRLFCL